MVMPSLFFNCPTVICSPNMLILMGETPLVNCGPRSILLHRIQSTAILVLLFSANIIIHTIHLILCYSKPVRLTTSLLSWGKVFWLCCAGSTLAPESLVLRRTTPLPTTFNVLLGSYWFDKPWFLTEGKLAVVRITPSSWGSQRTRVERKDNTSTTRITRR